MDLQRDISLNMVRVTEAAALKASRWMGNGHKNNADKAAVDAMRGMLDLLDIRGRIVIGEGEKDEAPMLYIGEEVGYWVDGAPEVDIAVDPIDGTRLVANGLPNALAVIAVGERNAIAYLPCFYVKKLAYGPKLKGFIDINCSIRENLKVTAAKLDKTVHDLTVAILDRERHIDYIKEVRECGARIKLIGDGDVAAAIATCIEDGRIDLYLGIGGSPEAVIAAAAIRCMEGDMQVKLAPKDEQEMEKVIESGYDLDKIYLAEDLAKGENIIFACTGITDGDLLPGIKFTGSKAISHSLVMRNKTKTIRYIQADHNLKYKTIPSKELKLETKL